MGYHSHPSYCQPALPAGRRGVVRLAPDAHGVTPKWGSKRQALSRNLARKASQARTEDLWSGYNDAVAVDSSGHCCTQSTLRFVGQNLPRCLNWISHHGAVKKVVCCFNLGSAIRARLIRLVKGSAHNGRSRRCWSSGRMARYWHNFGTSRRHERFL
jgi:hypothetical protein